MWREVAKAHLYIGYTGHRGQRSGLRSILYCEIQVSEMRESQQPRRGDSEENHKIISVKMATLKIILFDIPIIHICILGSRMRPRGWGGGGVSACRAVKIVFLTERHVWNVFTILSSTYKSSYMYFQIFNRLIFRFQAAEKKLTLLGHN
jgi:hypothetical protein